MKVGINQQTYHDLQDRDEGNHREYDAMRAGLDWAMDILGQGEVGRTTARASKEGGPQLPQCWCH